MSTRRSTHPEQLALLASPEVPLQFRLDERTRRIGLAGVAAAKALLAQQEARRAEREQRRRDGRPPMRAAA